MYCKDYLLFYKYNYVMENNFIIIIVIKNLKEVIMLISSPIMPAYYAQNYAGIIRQGLTSS